MTQRDVTWALVDIITYHYFWPNQESQDAVYGFTHSYEVNAICADAIPFSVTPVDKESLEEVLEEYVDRKGINTEDVSKIRTWLAGLPDTIAIIERDRRV